MTKTSKLLASILLLFLALTSFLMTRNVNAAEPESVKVAIKAKTNLTGRNLVDNEFTLNLINKETGETVLKAKNKADGSVVFDELSFNKTGDYRYTIKQELGSEAGITYDNVEYDVTVTVTEDSSGELKATVDKTENEIIFENSFDDTAVTSINVEKIWEDHNNRKKIRPDHIFIGLYRRKAREKVQPVALDPEKALPVAQLIPNDYKPVPDYQDVIVTPDAQGNWTYTFKNLPAYGSDGDGAFDWEYLVVETPIEGYEEPQIEGNMHDGFKITNKIKADDPTTTETPTTTTEATTTEAPTTEAPTTTEVTSTSAAPTTTEATTEAPTTTEVTGTSEAPGNPTTTVTPSTSEAPTTTEATTEAPTTTVAPGTSEAPTTTVAPTTTEAPTTTGDPSTTEAPTTTEDPATTTEASSATTKAEEKTTATKAKDPSITTTVSGRPTRKPHKVSGKQKGRVQGLPSTGEESGFALGLLGLVMVSITGAFYFRKQHH